MAPRMQEIEAARIHLAELSRQLEAFQMDNRRLREQTGVVRPTVSTASEEGETKATEITAMGASRAVRTLLGASRCTNKMADCSLRVKISET